MKRLRKKYKDRTIRYLMCGEYGEKNSRPHYHALIFGLDFVLEDPDIIRWDTQTYNDQEIQTWRSPILDRLWSVDGSPIGFCLVGAITFASAAYVARYIMKKVSGKPAEDHYKGRKPEYLAPSLGTGKKDPITGEPLDGGIGFDWYQKFGHELWPDDFVVINGKKYAIPGYYLRLLERQDPVKFKEIKLRRKISSIKKAPDRTPERLAVRKKVFQSRLSKLKRGDPGDS